VWGAGLPKIGVFAGRGSAPAGFEPAAQGDLSRVHNRYSLAKDRGCSHPGCDVPGYFCEVHHVTDYATCRTTDVNGLAFGCGGHHPLVEPGGWTTRKRKDGTTEWIPPPHLDRGQPRTNTVHHPEKLLRDEDEGCP
jgi:hypothetical protein